MPAVKLCKMIVAISILAVLMPAPASANLAFDPQTAPDYGLALMRSAAADPANAFAQMGSPGRPVASADLAPVRQEMAKDAAQFGELRTVALSEAQHLGVCVTARYRVRYANGTRYWLLHFRHTQNGADLDWIRTVD